MAHGSTYLYKLRLDTWAHGESIHSGFFVMLLSSCMSLNHETIPQLILVCDQILIVETLEMSFLHLLLDATLCHLDMESKVRGDKLARRDAIIDVTAECRRSIGDWGHCCV